MEQRSRRGEAEEKEKEEERSRRIKSENHSQRFGKKRWNIWGPAFCSVSTRLIREDHLRVTRRKKGHDKMLKILKNINPVFQTFTPQKHIQ